MQNLGDVCIVPFLVLMNNASKHYDPSAHALFYYMDEHPFPVLDRLGRLVSYLLSYHGSLSLRPISFVLTS